jgi:hypothetical protein
VLKQTCVSNNGHIENTHLIVIWSKAADFGLPFMEPVIASPYLASGDSTFALVFWSNPRQLA